MIQQFFQKKIAEFLNEFLEFQSSKLFSLQGLTFKNSKIKPKLVDIMSQMLGMPLQLTQGVVEQIRLNMPWQKMFLKKNSSIKVSMEGFKIKTRLKSQFNYIYNYKARQYLIQYFTSKLISSDQKESILVKKLKQYFLDTLQLEVKNIILQIECDLQQKIQLVFKYDSVIAKQQQKTNTITINASQFSISYRVVGSGDLQPLLYPTNISFSRNKISRQSLITSQKSFKIQKLHLNVNNNNFNDIRRFLFLVQWHNSFTHLPINLWRQKPEPLKRIKIKDKFKYFVKLIMQNFKDRNLKHNLIQRRKYFHLYNQVLKGTKDLKKLQNLAKIQDTMPIWKIIAYRNFCIEKLKYLANRKGQDMQKQLKISQIPQKDIIKDQKIDNIKAQSKLNGLNWMKSWFRTQANQKQLIQQLQKKLNQISTLPTVSLFSVQISQIIINVDIFTYSSKQNFLFVRALDFIYKYRYEDNDQDSRHEVICGKFKVTYEEYLGHHKKYGNMIQMRRQAQIQEQMNQCEQSEQEFEQVNNFLQFRTWPRYQLQMQPLKVCINHQIIQRLSVFDVEVFQKSYQNQQMKIIKHYDIYSMMRDINKSFSHTNKNNETQMQIEQLKTFTTGILIIVPQYMARQLCPCNQLVCEVQNFECKVIGNDKKIIDLKRISLKLNYPNEQMHNYQMLLNMGEIPVKTFTFVYPFSVNLLQKNSEKDRQKSTQVSIQDNILVDFESGEHLLKLIRLLYMLKPSSRQPRNLHRMRLRRKQSIGEQFIDACQNLNQHMLKSALSNSQIRIKKHSHIVQDKLKIIKISSKNIKIKLQECVINISSIIVNQETQGNQGFYLFSNNPKNIQVDIYQGNKFVKYLQRIKEEVNKILPNMGSTEIIDDRFQQDDSLAKSQQIRILNFNINLTIYHSKCILMQVETKNIQVIKDQSQKVLQLHVQIKYSKSCKRQQKLLPLTQMFGLRFQQKNTYNSLSKSISISPLTLNITPSIVRFLSKVYKIYLNSIQGQTKIQNTTLNMIKINTNGNRYYQLKPFQSQRIINEKQCNIIVFDQKIELNLMKQFQTYELTQNCCIIKTQKTPKNHYIQSNIKIVNLLEKTLWLVLQQAKNSMQLHRTQTIDLKFLSTAKSFDAQSQLSNIRQSKKQQCQQRVNMPLKPNDQYNLLINCQQRSLILFDQENSFQEITMTKILSTTETIIQNQEGDYLVLRTIKTLQNQIQYFRIEILAPLYIVNKLPWKLSYRIGKEALDFQEMVNTQGRVIRKRSFQVIPLQKILPLEHNKIRGIMYTQINDLQLTLDEFDGHFKLSNIIEAMIRSKTQLKKQQSSLICLSNGSRNIQLVLKLQISEFTLKLKVYPQYVFINMCEMNIQLKIKQSQYTYPNMKLNSLKQVCRNKQLSKDKQTQIQSFIKTYINLGNQKFNQKDILKQLFYDFDQNIQIFAGTINKKLKRYIVYESGYKNSSSSSGNRNLSSSGNRSLSLSSNKNLSSKSNIKNSILVSKSSGGYTSGSDGKQFQPQYITSQLLSQDIIQYEQSKAYIYYRNIKVQQYFNLVMLIPTVKLINKSSSTFMVKSKVNKTLFKVEGQQMNYLTVNRQGFSIQALQDNQEVNFNQWFNIDVTQFGTVFYAKQLASNGYQSKEYALRKKKLRKRPKVFYRIVLSQHQRGIQVLIEESQYPPISFINKTPMKLKIMEENQGFQEELGSNEMAEFACIKRPYQMPMFKLFYAEHYEYLFVQIFTVEQFRTIPCAKNPKFVISIEQFKDQKIVVFCDEKSLLMSEVKSQFQIEKIQKSCVNIESITFSFMNDFFKETSAFIISDVQLQVQQKSDKQYFKIKVADVQGYDYSSIQPNFTFLKLKQIQASDIFTKAFKAHVLPKNFLSINVGISYHKNATIVQKCHIRLCPIKIIFNSYLVLQTIKIYHKEVQNLINTITMYKQMNEKPKQKEFKDTLIKKQFIFQSFVWQSTSLTLKCLNLNVFCLFLDKKSYKWIVQFIQWIGDLKPINFLKYQINFENYTIQKLIKTIDIKKKVTQFIKIILQYPIRQLIDIGSIFLGINQKSSIQKIQIITKIVKAFGKLIMKSGIMPKLSLKKQQKDNRSQHLSYLQKFQQSHKQKQTILQKITEFEYAQWKYEQKLPQNKLFRSQIQRFQRYNLKNQIISYDKNHSKIKLALDCWNGNQIHRKIQYTQQVNQNFLIGLVDQFTILYFIKKNQWIVCTHQHILTIDICFKKVNKAPNSQPYLRIIRSLENKQTKNIQPNNNIIDPNQANYDKKLQTYEFFNFWLTQEKIISLKTFIQNNKLLTQY